MKRSSCPENEAGPSQKRLADDTMERNNQWNQYYKQADTSGKVVWSGTVKIPDEIVFDCSIKTLPQDEGIKSLFRQKPYTIHIIPVSTMLSLCRYQVDSECLILRTDESTDMMSYSAFSQAIRLDSDMRGCAVLKNTASALHLLCVVSYIYEHEDYIRGVIGTYPANDTVLGILRSHGLLPCAYPEHKKLMKQNAKLEEELRLKDKKLIEQQRLNQELVKRLEKEIAEKEEKQEERKMMVEQITTLERKIKEVQCEKKEMVNNLYLEFQCSICQDTMIEASCLPSCRHMFCKFCIGQWLEEKTKCPLCKQEAGIPVPYIGFDKAIDTAIGHFGKEAKQARIDAVKNRKAAIEIIHVRSLLVSSEESKGQSATSERESMTSDGESMISEEESVTSDGESMTSEGESMISEEEEMVPEHSCRVTELEASFVGPRESSADRSSEESLSEAAEEEQLHREPEEMQTTSFFSTLPPFLPLSSPSSSEDEPTLS